MKDLELLKKVQKVEAPPFLLTRVRAKIRAEERERLPAAWLWSGALAFGLLLWLNFALASDAPIGTEINIAAQYGLHSTQQLYVDEN